MQINETQMGLGHAQERPHLKKPHLNSNLND